MDLDFWDCFGNDKTHIIANLHRTDLVICSQSREEKTPVLLPNKYCRFDHFEKMNFIL